MKWNEIQIQTTGYTFTESVYIAVGCGHSLYTNNCVNFPQFLFFFHCFFLCIDFHDSIQSVNLSQSISVFVSLFVCVCVSDWCFVWIKFLWTELMKQCVELLHNLCTLVVWWKQMLEFENAHCVDDAIGIDNVSQCISHVCGAFECWIWNILIGHCNARNIITKDEKEVIYPCTWPHVLLFLHLIFL